METVRCAIESGAVPITAATACIFFALVVGWIAGRISGGSNNEE